MDAVLQEEYEVLESIYASELTKLSEREISIDAEPDDLPDGADYLKVTLGFRYPDDYPDCLPELSLVPVEGELTPDELESLLTELNSVGNENLGMAMTFTIVSHLREQLSALVRTRSERLRKEEVEKERLILEAEEARTRGTAVTPESFKAWKLKFDRELAMKKAKEDDEKLKGLTPKEREEWKRQGTRLSGRQLFERDKDLDDDLEDDGTVSVDVTQYERERTTGEEEEERITFSDSD